MTQGNARRRIERIISGGQTGADRGALDAALALGIPHGGWCPLGRLAEDGVIPSRYQLTETDSPRYRVRTLQNVIESDATLIFYRQSLQGGTELTRRFARQHDKPYLMVDLRQPPLMTVVQSWLESAQVSVLNVAGPRESSVPGMAREVQEYLQRLLAD